MKRMPGGSSIGVADHPFRRDCATCQTAAIAYTLIETALPNGAFPAGARQTPIQTTLTKS